MTAAALSALGVPTLLVANSIGDDAEGIDVRRWLQHHRVTTTATVMKGAATPVVVVVADGEGTRTWFSYLPEVVGALSAVDLTPLDAAPFAYVDCYQLIEAPAVRAIHAARVAGVPLLVNLGGSPLSTVVAAALCGHRRLVVQTNVDDAACKDAPRVAADLRSATGADWVVVTAGASGVVALSETRCLQVPAFRVTVRHTHCAGAAFSGGLLYGLLHDWPIADSLVLACASGALRCERAHHQPMPDLADLHAFIGSRERTTMPTA